MTTVHLPPWNSWHNEVLAFAAITILMGSLIGSHLQRGIQKIAVPFIAWPLCLLSFVVFLQVIAGQIAFAGDGVVLFFYFILCAFALLIGHAAASANVFPDCSPKAFVEMLAFFVLLGGVLSTVVALAQVLDVWDSSWIARMQSLRRPGGNIGQPNQLATLLLFSASSLVFLFESQRIPKIVGIVIGLVLVGGFAMTESRGGMLSLLCMTAWWIAKRHRIGFSLPPWAISLWLSLAVCCFWFWPALFAAIQAGGGSADEVAHVSIAVGTRSVVWPQLWAAVLMHPIAGWGLREVSTAHNVVLDGNEASEAFAYAHNIVLDLAIGVGLPLTTVLVGAVAVWFWRRAQQVNDLMTWYCMAIALPLAVHSLLEYPFAYAYLLVPALVLVGVLEARLSPASVKRVALTKIAIAWGFVSVAMAWSVVEYIAIEEDFRVVRFEALRMGKTPDGYERPHVILLTQLGALLDGGRIIPAPSMSPEQLELLRKVAMRFPWTATQNRYALSLALNGRSDEARHQLQVMRALNDEKSFQPILDNWKSLGNSKYPQLREFVVP